MTKEQIVTVLETIATLLELQEENPFKIRAYTNAARSIETWGGNLREMAEENRLEEIPGVGKAIAGKITELALTGSSRFYDELRAKFPPGILELIESPLRGRENHNRPAGMTVALVFHVAAEVAARPLVIGDVHRSRLFRVDVVDRLAQRLRILRAHLIGVISHGAAENLFDWLMVDDLVAVRG